MTTPLEIMERMKALPEHLQPHHRRCIVEAVTDETRAPLLEYYRLTRVAEEAAQEWAKANGAAGFYPPNQGIGRGSRSVRAFSFKVDGTPNPPGWKDAGRGYVQERGHVALVPDKRPAGKKISAEIAALPQFPGYEVAIDSFGEITGLRTENSTSSVGCGGGSMHFTIPIRVGERYFISFVNHNFDIARMAEQAAEYLAGENPEWARSLDFIGDPISWRVPEGWQVHTKAEFEFLVASYRLHGEREAAA